ncbi:HEPN domain-containing protein [uncultured Alsobacter sp.]|uniref:HEPN domain-containing protein n=1 Tax=uncultured Alsobacter sp. TaxID=1748258 RepID=UPI0025DDDEE3|nr:HEPN domain-containing protein [uncultured Alsobacter sp.]
MLPKYDQYGKYTVLSVRKMIGYRLLCHAALETYFETISKKIIDGSYSRYKSSGHINEYLFSTCMRFSRLGGMKDNEFLQKQKGKIEMIVKEAVDWQSNNVNKNNGIKKENIEDLFICYGSSIVFVYAPAIQRLDSYGSIRGLYAHVSPAQTQIPDPKDEKKQISDILLDLKTPDISIGKIISGI